MDERREPWLAFGVTDVGSDPAAAAASAERLIGASEYMLAYDIAMGGLEVFPGDVRLRQLQALTLYRTGAVERAIVTLDGLRREGHLDEETLGMLAGAHKRLWQHSDFAAGESHARDACTLYLETYRQTRGCWPGINAATLSLLLGDADQAQAIARSVAKDCRAKLPSTSDGEERYWLLASLGEVALLMGDLAAAEDHYAHAVEAARDEWSCIATTRQNARLLLERAGVDPSWMDTWLPLPSVAAFVGHMVDAPGRATPRFPPELEAAVFEAIAEQIRRHRIRIGYASAARGSDILFHEALVASGGRSYVVLPYDRDQFAANSVNQGGGDWPERYRRVLERASDVIAASPERSPSPRADFDYCNLLLLGLAKVRAQQLETRLVPTAVWDGDEGDGPGGTASVVERWRTYGHDVRVIDLRRIVRESGMGLGTSGPTAPAAAWGQVRGAPSPNEGQPLGGVCAWENGAGSVRPPLVARIVGILFADVVGSTRLADRQVTLFVEHFWGEVASLLQRLPVSPAIRNTWGDALYLVLEDTGATARAALDLCDLVARTDWAAHGLPADLGLRVALHAGPSYLCHDPVTGRDSYVGAHVWRAARTVPITPPGYVYASAEFAALVAAQGADDIQCEYVGRVPLAKQHGSFPTYLVRRAHGRV